jgi:nucleotide-binding universal stress UspA family protein
LETSKISKILLAIDGSHLSMDAAGHAVKLAKKFNAKLIALTILNTQPWFYSFTRYGWTNLETTEKVHESDRRHVQTWLARIKETAEYYDIRLLS